LLRASTTANERLDLQDISFVNSLFSRSVLNVYGTRMMFKISWSHLREFKLLHPSAYHT
jgi:hypothetical protein